MHSLISATPRARRWPLSKTVGLTQSRHKKSGDLRLRIKNELEKQSSYSEPAARAPEQQPIVVLGHPDTRLSKDVQQHFDELVHALQGRGIAPILWPDGWANPGDVASRNRAAELFQENPIFIQPLGVYDARTAAIEPEFTREALAEIAGSNLDKLSSRIVLWLPPGLSERRFDQAQARPPTMTSRSSAEELAAELFADIRGEPPELPIVLMEEFAFDLNLRAALKNGFRDLVSQEIRQPPEMWGLDASVSSTILERQISLIRGNKVIIAIHDLNIENTRDPAKARKSIESKFTATEERVLRARNVIKLPLH